MSSSADETGDSFGCDHGPVSTHEHGHGHGHGHDHDHPHDEADRFSAEADTWDAKPGAFERAAAIAAAIRSTIPLSRNDTALEIGGGTGLLSRALSEDIRAALVTDVAPGMVAAAERALDDPRYAGWRSALFDVEHDPLLPERFDLVLSQLALHHMGDVPTILGRLFELLRPGGHLAVADLEHDADGGFHRHVEGFHGHHGFTREELVSWLHDAGFVDVTIGVATHHKREVDGEERLFPLLLATGRRPSA